MDEVEVEVTATLVITFQAEDVDNRNESEIAEMACNEVRDQLRIGRRHAGYWSATPAEDVVIEGHVRHRATGMED